ncbi:MAG: toll/interleukin-1 receptor domain-containing protein, partial [Acidobacteriota bacterium]
MPPGYVFISHATEDDDFVKELRLALRNHQLTAWDDAYNMSGGDKLNPEIDKAIEEARQFI